MNCIDYFFNDVMDKKLSFDEEISFSAEMLASKTALSIKRCTATGLKT